MPTIAEQEAALRAQLAALHVNRREREVIEAIKAGALPQVRLAVPGADAGVPFALTPAEATLLVPTLRAIAEARLAAAKSPEEAAA